MSLSYLVTGGNGHLGSNLVRALVDSDCFVRASVRNAAKAKALDQINCEIVYADMLDYTSLLAALNGIDVLFHTAAVFRHWAPDPDKEIIQPNLLGTENILRAAAACGVRRVIYVSSIVALGRDKLPMSETTWNTTNVNPYYQSKTEAEQLAWRLAKELGLDLITVLPAAIIGPVFTEQLTPTMQLLFNIAHNRVPFDVNFGLNCVHVNDVVEGMLLASELGRAGERYILGNRNSISTGQIFDIAEEMGLGIVKPPVIQKSQLMSMAKQALDTSNKTGNPPAILPYVIEAHYGVEVSLNIDKSEKELGFKPMPTDEAIRDSIGCLV